MTTGQLLDIDDNTTAAGTGAGTAGGAGAGAGGEAGAGAGAGARSLSRSELALVKSTAHLFALHGHEITRRFYARMLKAEPELRNMFNLTNQSSGAQSAALALAVFAYSSRADDLDSLAPITSMIAQKHTSLHVQPKHYPIVGQHLLAAMQEVLEKKLGKSISTNITTAWKATYDRLAEHFIKEETKLYKQAAEKPGGWIGWKKYKVARRIPESDEVVSFDLVPADGSVVPRFEPGQYISVKLFVPELGVEQPRQYSLSCAPGSDRLSISVRREDGGIGVPAGVLSTLMHRQLKEGDLLDVTPPYGAFRPDTSNPDDISLLLLCAGGIGITPLLSILQTVLVDQPKRPVHVVYAARTASSRAFHPFLLNLVERHSERLRLTTWLDTPDGDDDMDPANANANTNAAASAAVPLSSPDVDAGESTYRGYVDLRLIVDSSDESPSLPSNTVAFVCGGIPFMRAVEQQLGKLGLSKSQIHMQAFGSELHLYERWRSNGSNVARAMAKRA